MPERSTPIKFVTLGPPGTNHAMMVSAYAEFRELKEIETLFVDDFIDALTMVKTNQADYLLICGVHPQCPTVIAQGSFRYGVHLIDTFISPSQPLGIISRKDVKRPKTLALHPATASYTDISAWSSHVNLNSTMEVAEGLLEGKYDSGITMAKLADEHPDKLRLDKIIGSPDDPWLILGPRRVSNGEIIACKDAPASRLMKSQGKK